LVKVGVKPFGVLAYVEDLSPIAFFGRNDSKTEEAATQKRSAEGAILGIAEADLAPPSSTLSLTKQALRMFLSTSRTLQGAGMSRRHSNRTHTTFKEEEL
jgi:hypothetical protein